MNRRIIVLIIILLSTVFIYLNRSYARIYQYLDKKFTTPYTQRNFDLPNLQTDNTIKYVALGDSLTAGVGSMDYTQTFPYLIAQNLTHTYKVEFINLAVSGATSDDLIDNQLPDAIKENPDLVTLLIGVNDVHRLSSPESFEKNLDTILNKLTTETKARIIILNLPNLGPQKLMVFPYSLLFQGRTQQFNKVITTLATKYSIQLIDIYTLTRDNFDKDLNLYSQDLFHPSEKGYMLWAQLINESTN